MTRSRGIFRRGAEKVLFLLIAVIILLPIVWGIITSFKGSRDLFAYPPKIFNFKPVLDNYRLVFEGGILQSVVVSILYCLSAILLGLLFGSLCAYGLKRAKFRGRKLIFYLVVAGIPLSTGSAALLIPNYMYMSSLGMVNQWYTLPLMYTAYNLPMAIWVMMGGIDNIPYEIEEAASVDGCSRWYIIFRLIPALNKPALASAALFIFIGAWNEFNVASVMINSPELRPVQQSIYYYMGFFGLDWGALTAAATVTVVPVLLIFTFLGRFLVSGLTSGAVKG